jgi:glycosyltransferase involved in cell wall biosynthesis
VRIAGERSVGSRFRGVRRAAYARVLSHADAVITNSQRNKSWMEQAYGRAGETIHVIHNGCTLPVPSPAPVVQNMRRALGIDAGEFVIATLTHLTPEKDVACLVRAAARLTSQGVKFRLVIAGEGPCADALRQIMSAHQLESRVILAGHVPHSEALLIAQLCDAFALPSRFEGMPNALMEAMSFGRASVASNVGGIPELIEHGQTGLLFEAGNDAALAGHLGRLASDPELRRRLGQSAHSRIAAEFSIEKMVRSHEDLYRALLGNAAPVDVTERLAG